MATRSSPLSPCQTMRTLSLLLVLCFAVVALVVEAQENNNNNNKNDVMWQVLHAANLGNPAAQAMVLENLTTQRDQILHMAIQKGLTQVVQLILDQQPEACCQQFESYGTALHTAASFGQLDIGQRLLESATAAAANKGQDDDDDDKSEKRTDTLRSYLNMPSQQGFRPLHWAAQNGHVEMVQFLLDQGALILMKPTTAAEAAVPSPLHLAAHSNQLEVVRVLLEYSGEYRNKLINHQVSIGGWTPLHLAVQAGHADIVQLLLNQGADSTIQSTEASGMAAIHIASGGFGGGDGSLEAHADIIALLAAADPDSVNVKNAEGRAPLHVAAESNSVLAVKALVAAGADVEVKNQKGFSPLHWAIYLGDKLQTAAALLEAGANPNAINIAKGLVPLHSAAHEGYVDEIALLLVGHENHKAVPDMPDLLDGATPLAYAAREGWHQTVQALLQHGGEAVCRTHGHTGLTPLHLAAVEGRVQVMALLLEGCPKLMPVDVPTTAGHTPLHAAAHAGQMEAVQLLLEEGANVTARTKAGITPIQAAAQEGWTAVVELLSKHGGEAAAVSEMKERSNTCNSRDGNSLPQESQECVLTGASDVSQTDDESIIPGASWPWNHASPLLIGHVNMTFNDRDNGKEETHTFPLHALPVIETDRGRADLNFSEHPFLLEQVHAAAIRTSTTIGDSARELLRSVKRLRRALTKEMGVSSVRFWSTHFPMEKLKRSAADENNKSKKLAKELQSTIERYIDEMMTALAPVFGCAVEDLRCPDFGQYYRFDSDHYLNYVHRDFPSENEARFNHEHGLTRDDWLNVWVLLSEKPYGYPLTVLDAGPLVDYPSGYVVPTKEMLHGSSDGPVSWRAYTFHEMQPGDAMSWRTTTVPHAGGRLVRTADWRGWEDTAATYQLRESIDIRCACLKTFEL